MRPVAGFRFGARLSLGNDGCCINALAVHGASTVAARAGREVPAWRGGTSSPAFLPVECATSTQCIRIDLRLYSGWTGLSCPVGMARATGDVRDAADYSADMTVWQYAQLTVTVARRPVQGDTRSVLWHGPRPGGDEDYSRSGQTALELLNRFGADGWELAGIQDYYDGAAESSHWDARRLVTIYTFKRLQTPAETKSADNIQKDKGGLRSQQAGIGLPAHPKGDNLAELESAGALVRFTVYWRWDSEAEANAAYGSALGLAIGGLVIERKVVRLPSRADIGEIEASCIEYENPETSQDRREEIKKAAADYAASWMEGQWGDTWWKTSPSFPFSKAADVLNGSADWLRGLVEHPLADVASAAGAEGPVVSISAGMTTRFVTEPVTARLEGVARICEIAGIVIGTAVGAHPLVMACVKRLVHDEFNDLLAKGLEQIPDTIEQMLHSMDVDRRPAQDEAPRPAPPVPARPNSKRPPRPAPEPSPALTDPAEPRGPQPPSPGQAVPPPFGF